MNTPKKDVRTQARERELEALKALANVGWLSTKNLALWVWTESTEHVAVNKAQLVLKRLEKSGEVLKRETPTGIAAWILTKKGAERVNTAFESEGYKGWAHHGYDLGLIDWARTHEVGGYLANARRQSKVIGVVGPAGLRAGVIPDMKEADGAYILDDYTKVGVVIVKNARDGIQEVVKTLVRKNIKLDFVGDKKIVDTLRKRVLR